MTLNDTIYVFENIDIQWSGIFVPNCQAIYVPTANLNLVGAKFMQRFNFVLDYSDRKTNKHEHGIKSTRDLYILPAKNFHSIQSTPYISDFGFSIGSITEELIVSDIEIGGLAENAGMKLRDKLLSIDNGTFDINQEDRHKNFIAYLAGKNQVTVQIEREGQVFDIKITKN
jgi:predicted metalloprotease with PDZ domain